MRSARRDRGWTLEDLAERAGISASTLSRLEAGKRQASLELLLPVTRELGIRVDDLLLTEHGDPRVHRAVERRDGMVIAPLTLESSPVKTFKVTYEPVATAPAPRVHEGYEWVYVLSGRLRLFLEDREHVLERGEAAEFDTRTPHSLSGAGQKRCEALSIFSAAGERIHIHGSH